MSARLLTYLLAFVVFCACLIAPGHAAPLAAPGGQYAAIVVVDGGFADAAEALLDEHAVHEQRVPANVESPSDNSYPLHASPVAPAAAAMMDPPNALVLAALRPLYLDTPQRPPCAALIAA